MCVWTVAVVKDIWNMQWTGKKSRNVTPLSAEVIQTEDAIGVSEEVWGYVGYEGCI